MQDFTGAKPNIDTLCVENTTLRADIEELEANNSALAAKTVMTNFQLKTTSEPRSLGMLFDPPHQKKIKPKKLKHSTVKKVRNHTVI